MCVRWVLTLKENRQEWKQCVLLACDGGNGDALVVLEEKRAAVGWSATLEDFLEPVMTLCRASAIEALDALLRTMPEVARNAMLRDIQLCARCCLHNAHKALTFLVSRYGKVFINESHENAADMCIALAYRTGAEDLFLAVLERARPQNPQVRVQMLFFLFFF